MPISKDFQIELAPDSKAPLLLGPDTPYIVHNLDVLTMPDVRVADTDRPRDHGTFTSYDYVTGRTVTLDLDVTGTSPEDTRANVEALKKLWHPVTSAPGDVVPISFQLPGDITKRVLGRPRKASFDMSTVLYRHVATSLEFFAPDPRIYSDVTTTLSLGLPQTSGGVTFPLLFPLAFGTVGTGGVEHLTNGGDFPTRPVVTLNGPLSNPRLTNVTTGETMSFTIDLASGDTLTIDFDQRTVMLNTTATRYSTLDAGSVWWELQPGDNEIQFAAASPNPNASASFTWRDAWL